MTLGLVDIGFALVDLGVALTTKPIEYSQVKRTEERKLRYQREKASSSDWSKGSRDSSGVSVIDN